MTSKLGLILGMLWASPVTSVAFIFYILPLWLLGRYAYDGWDEVAWVWTFNPAQAGEDRLTRFLRKRWRRWSGSTLGNVIILKADPLSRKGTKERIRIHEKEHVRQFMRLGPFHPIAYGLVYLIARVSLRNVDAYYDNIFEIDARRKAGEFVDIAGIIQKLKDS